MTILVTGGAGFIGGNFVLDWLAQSGEPVVNVDKLTYAGNLETLASLNGHPGHIFVQADIGDRGRVRLGADHIAGRRCQASQPNAISCLIFASNDDQQPIQATPVILCGGSGTRLWPLSRTGFPKQFLCLTGNESLFQLAARRLSNLASASIQVAPPLIVTGEEHRFLATEQLREAGIAMGAALLEPFGKNTAPALTLAALAATENGADPVLVVTPADQTVVNDAAFTQALQAAIVEAASGKLVILGITPTQPETGYGYIQTHPANGARRQTQPCWSSALLKSLTTPLPLLTWQKVVTTGMPACLC
jgi:uncharacterized protein YbjT (DUF2867 family)